MAAALPRKQVSFDSKPVVINEVSNPHPVEKEEVEIAAFMEEEDSDSDSKPNDEFNSSVSGSK